MNRRAIGWTIGATFALLLSVIIAIGMGAASLDVHTTFSALTCRIFDSGCGAVSKKDLVIIWDIRAVRIALAILVGFGLSICGAVIQSLVRNIMADPYLLGIASGASTGAATVMVFGVAGAVGLTAGAFLGALTAITAVLALTSVAGTITAERVVFAGITIGLFMMAIMNIVIMVFGNEGAARAVMFWMLGYLGGAHWYKLVLPFLVLIFTFVFCMAIGPRLDAISLSDETARILGFNPQRLRIIAIIVVSGCVAALVAVSGTIGFVGLVIPHLARRLVGATSRSVIPVSGVLGALLLMWADTLGRTMFSPRELPIGVVTALIGTPVLMVLIRRQYRST